MWSVKHWSERKSRDLDQDLLEGNRTLRRQSHSPAEHTTKMAEPKPKEKLSPGTNVPFSQERKEQEGSL